MSMKKKKFDIRRTFESFLAEPLSVLTNGLFQIVNIEGENFFAKENKKKLLEQKDKMSK